jgi:peptidyl-prolyl cis-trans isomerase SurA
MVAAMVAALSITVAQPAAAPLRLPQSGGPGVAPLSQPSPMGQRTAPGATDAGGAAGATTGGAATDSAAALSRTPPGPVPVDRIVAVINQEAITESELDTRLRMVARRMLAQGVQPPPEEVLRRQLLERMIVDRAQLQAAREVGIRVDDATVDRAIGRIAADNRLSLAQLRERLERDGVPFRAFREEIRQEIVLSRLREREVEARIQVSEAEIDAFLAEQAAQPGGALQYDIAQVLVRLPDDPPAELVARQQRLAEAIAAEVARGVEPAQAAGQHPGQGVEASAPGLRPAERWPDLFVRAVERLAPGQVAPVVRSRAGFHVLKLVDRRAAGAPIATAPVEQFRVRHILMRVDEVNGEPEVLRRMREVRERIAGGTASFDDMARQYSVDGSARQGGDIGWIYPGDTVPEFERAMRALRVDELSEPVRTPFGYHLIQVVERRTDEASPERIRAAARGAVRERKAGEALSEWERQVRDRAYVEVRLDDQ